MVEEITDQNFKEKIAEGLSFVDFWAPWCGPCRMQSPIVQELAEEDDGTVSYYMLNVDDEPETSQQFGVMSIPTMIIFKDGEAVETLIGVHGKEQLEEAIDKHR